MIVPPKLLDGAVIQLGGAMKLSTAVNGYLLFAKTKYAAATVSHYEQTLQNVIVHLHDPEIERISVEDLQKYFIYLRTEYKPFKFRHIGEKPTLMTEAGVEGYWKAIRSFYKWAEANLNAKRPDKFIPQPKYKMDVVRAFSKEEMKKLIYFAEWVPQVKSETKQSYRMHRSTYKRDVALVKFMIDTGLRVGEICRVKISDVDLETGSVNVAAFGSGQKTKPRTVYIGKSARQSMWLYLANTSRNKDEPLFDTTENNIRKLVKSIGEKAGVENCHPHRFRHTFAIEFLRNNRDPFSLMRLLGHSDLEMSNHYLEILDSDLAHFHYSASPVDNIKM
jgi:integrase/recombinase XerD